MSNKSIRDIIKKYRFNFWEVANEVGISEGTFSRWLRNPLTEERESRILAAINRLRERDAE